MREKIQTAINNLDAAIDKIERHNASREVDYFIETEERLKNVRDILLDVKDSDGE